MTAPRQPGLQALPAGPLQIELRFLLHLPAEEVFDLVAFRLPEWFGEIHAVAWDHAPSGCAASEASPCARRS